MPLRGERQYSYNLQILECSGNNLDGKDLHLYKMFQNQMYKLPRPYYPSEFFRDLYSLFNPHQLVISTRTAHQPRH
jgi:hypothetical protein